MHYLKVFFIALLIIAMAFCVTVCLVMAIANGSLMWFSVIAIVLFAAIITLIIWMVDLGILK